MKYYFIPGRNFQLSKQELLSILNQYVKEYTLEYLDEFCITVSSKNDFNANELFHRLGGFLSYGEVISSDFDFLSLVEDKEKVVFGINKHGKGKSSIDLKDLAENIKKILKENGKSAKFIIDDRGSSNSINIEQNEIFEKGFLLEIIESNKETVFGIAKAIQDVSLFTKVEYEKPYTDKKVGILPAKLARMMVNFAGIKKGDTLWDPFCGSGTILLEAQLQGINVLGSDVSPKAIEMCEANINWLSREMKLEEPKFKIFRLDIVKPDGKTLGLIRNTSIDALVCEPFMGPPQRSLIPLGYAKRLLDNVKKLYKSLFEILEHSKLTNFKAVIVVPSYKTNRGWLTMKVSEFAGKKWEIVNKKGGGYLQWSRSDSIISRNIFILNKKK